MPTIYEVVKRAGVSPSTVSRVLSRPDVVSAETRLRVMRTVDRLGYIPNSTAKNLRRARTGNDEMAIGVLELARSKRIRVPRDLSVVGFDDIRFARYMEPPLTTVSQPMRAIGEGTVRLLLAIRNDGAVTPDSVTLPHTLVTRGSTAVPPARR